MEIDHARTLLLKPTADARDSQSLPSAQEVSAFTQALFGPEHKLPEDVGASRLQETASGIDMALRNARDLSAVMKGPVEILNAQSALLRSVITVDLIAKTAGTVSQGINKLANMQ
ncbi:MAG TPA: type III secretion system inner rod subunit SctI [Trinickia sp.]|jgi:type III secretion system YscI/HrpB-like protein|nr:type III secretion system inner rod subunit SctI [Trinickia sp.]